MSSPFLYSGYYGIYNGNTLSSYSNINPTSYMVSTRFGSALAIMPLEPGFYDSIVKYIALNPHRTIYLIAPDLGPLFISDFYRLFDYIYNHARGDCKIFTRYIPHMTYQPIFEEHIIRSKENKLSINIPLSINDNGTMTFSFDNTNVNVWSPYTADVVLDDSVSRKYFTFEMNPTKAEMLIKDFDSFDELHTPYIRGCYYNELPYDNLVNNYNKLSGKAVLSRFGSNDELRLAQSRNLKIGEVFKNGTI